MELRLNNGLLEVRLESFGAELVGLRDLENNREYMWQKDSKFWAKCSPILFPFVGAIKRNTSFYLLNFQLYTPFLIFFHLRYTLNKV